jgi:hypothetical protein
VGLVVHVDPQRADLRASRHDRPHSDLDRPSRPIGAIARFERIPTVFVASRSPRPKRPTKRRARGRDHTRRGSLGRSDDPLISTDIVGTRAPTTVVDGNPGRPDGVARQRARITRQMSRRSVRDTRRE